MGRLQFLKDKKFYLHLLLILLSSVLLFFITFWLLKAYTRHDKEYSMPDFIGMDYQQVQHDHSREFNFIVIDSVYPKGWQPGSIYKQDPLPGAKIKRGRNVYTIIVALTPEKTDMPELKVSSLREAIERLQSSGLEVDHLEYVTYHPYTNNVADQYYQGKPIEVGTKIPKGSKIVLKVGLGKDKTTGKIPNIIGKSCEEAKYLLNRAGFNLGKEVFEDNDSIQYQCVKRMSPGPSSGLVQFGTYVDVWYHSNRTLDFKKEMQNLLKEEAETNKPQPEPVIDTIPEPKPEPKEAETTNTIDSTDINSNEEDFEDDF